MVTIKQAIDRLYTVIDKTKLNKTVKVTDYDLNKYTEDGSFYFAFSSGQVTTTNHWPEDDNTDHAFILEVKGYLSGTAIRCV